MSLRVYWPNIEGTWQACIPFSQSSTGSQKKPQPALSAASSLPQRCVAGTSAGFGVRREKPQKVVIYEMMRVGVLWLWWRSGVGVVEERGLWGGERGLWGGRDAPQKGVRGSGGGGEGVVRGGGRDAPQKGVRGSGGGGWRWWSTSGLVEDEDRERRHTSGEILHYP